MPRSNDITETKDELKVANSKTGFRTRKTTPMKMPQADLKLKSSVSIESIPEDSEEMEDADIETSTELQLSKDGTFLLPKLNKVETAPKQSFKSEAIKVDLRHHLFEHEPLRNDKEEVSRVKLGKCLGIIKHQENKIKRKPRPKKVSNSNQTLPLVIEENPKVDLPCFLPDLFNVLMKVSIKASYVSKSL